MSTYKTDLEKMLRNVRQACGFTQHEVADILHVHRTTYTYYETGESSPDVATLHKLAAVFGIPVEAFLHPEKYASMEMGKIRVRTRKIPLPDPQRIGDLTKEEKKLIQTYRMDKGKALV